MDVLQHYSQTRFMGYVPKIKKNTGEWYIVEIMLAEKAAHNAAFIALKLKEYFEGREGVIFICNSRNVLVLAHMGVNVSVPILTKDIHEKLPEHSCTAKVGEVTPEGLNKIQLRLDALGAENTNSLLTTRQERSERIVMVVDDDMLIRSLVSKTFRTRGRVIEFRDTEKVLEAYLEYLPDVLFLDIHLPDGSGLDLLAKILQFDPSAYVIILSADSVKDNILNAKEHGAQGFIVKPFTLEKLESSYARCPSISHNHNRKS